LESREEGEEDQGNDRDANLRTPFGIPLALNLLALSGKRGSAYASLRSGGILERLEVEDRSLLCEICQGPHPRDLDPL
jgi:hypothetical protein